MTNIVVKSSDKDKEMESSPTFPSGIWTSENLTGGSLEAMREWLTSFPQASHNHVSPSQSQENEQERMTRETSGLKRGMPLASFDPDTSSWRMSQASLLPSSKLYTDCYGLDGYGGLRALRSSELPMSNEYNPTWPKWGTIVNGELFPLPMSELLISEKGGGVLPTPSAISYGTNLGGAAGRKGKIRPSLETMARKNIWPTPTSGDHNRGMTMPDGKRGQSLVGAARNQTWPTPASRDYRSGKNKNCWNSARPLNEMVTKYPTPSSSMMTDADMEQARYAGSDKNRPSYQNAGTGSLNPDWVEWLMGWPISWTSLESLKDLIWLDWSIDPADDGSIPRVATGIKDRVNRLKAIGNGQVSLCVKAAWEILTK